MQSLKTQPIDPDTACYICLMGPGELAPLCSKAESNDWVQPCKCSLIVHRKCFLSWVSSLNMEETRNRGANNANNDRINPAAATTVDNNNNNDNQFINTDIINTENDLNIQINLNSNNIQPNLLSYSIQNLFLGLPLSLHSKTTILFVNCPQCKREIHIKTKDSPILNLHYIFTKNFSKIVQYGLTSSVASTGVAALGTSVLMGLSSVGLGVLQQLAPQSVQLTMFDVVSGSFTKNNNKTNKMGMGGLGTAFGIGGVRTLGAALETGVIPLTRFYAVTASLPLYMVYLRMDVFNNPFLNLIFQSFPFLISNGRFNDIRTTPVKKLVWLTMSLKYVYKLVYSLGLNRIYYKWCKQVQPCFIADRMSLQELERMEKEIEEEYEYMETQQRLSNKSKSKDGSDDFNDTKSSQIYKIIKKVINFLIPSSFICQLKLSKLKRDMINCWKFDYSKVFQSRNFYLFLSTTLSWPYLGSLLSGLLLSKIPNINAFLNKFVNTADEAEFLKNLIGCVVVVVIKDLINLYFNYKKFKQLRDVDVVSNDEDDFLRYLQRTYRYSPDENQGV